MNNNNLPRITVREGFFCPTLSHSACVHISKALQGYLEANPDLFQIQDLADMFHIGGVAAALSLTATPKVKDEAQILLNDMGVTL